MFTTPLILLRGLLANSNFQNYDTDIRILLPHKLLLHKSACPAALTLPDDAIFLEGVANPVQVCATYDLPENASSQTVIFPSSIDVPVTFTAGSAGIIIIIILKPLVRS